MTAFGIATRFRRHIGPFSLVFWEAKGVSGAVHPPVPGAISMVSCFGDNRVGRSHPQWVQVAEDGSPATRASRYLDWTALCPSHEAVRALARQWIHDAATPDGIRLDDVNFARGGFCQCAVCGERARVAGLSPSEWRQTVLTQFVEEVRRETVGPLYLTLYPDPYPGRLEADYGVPIDDLRRVVDVFVVPIYDMAYSTTWWIEAIGRGFRDRLAGHPFLIELYALGVDEARLAKAALVAGAYADGIIMAYGDNLAVLERLRQQVEATP